MNKIHSIGFKAKYFLQRTKKRAVYGMYNKNIQMMESKELWEICKQYKYRFARTDMPYTDTNIKIKSSTCLNSYCRDYGIEQLLKNGDCQYPKMICITNPYRYAPLTGLLLFRCEKNVKVEYSIKGRGKTYDHKGEVDYAREHKVPIIGLYPGMNKLRLRLIDEEGNVFHEREMALGTKTIPGSLKNMITKKQFHSPCAYEQIFITGGLEVPFAFDYHCDIRYYLDTETSMYGVFPLKNGHFLWPEAKIGVPTFANAHTVQVHEMDYMGRVYKTFLVEKGMHHFAAELPNGNIVTVSNSMEGHTEDVVIEFDRTTGAIEKTINMVDLFGDKYRDQVDWAHVNSVRHDPKDNTLLLCLRNIHSVIKFDYDTLEVKWILSIPEFWEGTKVEDKLLTPIGEVEWNYQAHAAYELDRTPDQPEEIHKVLVFDNHHNNRRPVEIKDKSHSHVHVYEVNEKEHTVGMLMDIPMEKSYVRSNARYDAKSNHMFGMLGSLSRQQTEARGRVVEVDCDTLEIINSCYIAKDFFSGYEFKLDLNDFTRQVTYAKEYMVGQLTPLKVTDEKLVCSEAVLPQKAIQSIVIREDILYFKAVDHAVEKFYFQGEEITYVKDYTDTYQINDIHRDRSYFCILPLYGMKKGRYKIVVQYLGKVYSTQYWIEYK